MDLENLSPDLREKANACKSPEDLFELAREEGYELSDDELEAVSGGDWDCWTVCTKFEEPEECTTFVNGPSPW